MAPLGAPPGATSDPSAGEAAALRSFLAPGGDDPWAATIDRRLVHRRTVADVLITALRPRGEGEAVIAAQWPRAQPFYRAIPNGSYDASLVVETLRQAGLALSHRQLGVEVGRKFLLSDFRVEIVDARRLLVGAEPADLLLASRFTDVRTRAGVVRSGRMEARLYRDGGVVAQTDAGFTCMDIATYERVMRAPLGGEHAAHGAGCRRAADPADVGRRDDEDVLLCRCADRGTWGLRVSPQHPALFDHPLDHVPGMALFEACRQAALLARGGKPTGFDAADIAFSGLVPLRTPAVLECTPEGERIGVAVWDRDMIRASASFVFGATAELTEHRGA